MNDFFEKNKTFIGIIIGALIIGGFIYLSNSPSNSPSQNNQRFNPDSVPSIPSQTGSVIDYTEASKYVGEYKTVRGKVDNVFISNKNNSFLNFCPNYKTCSFSATIFSSDASKFSNIRGYEGKTVEITGLIKTYQGRPEIIINDPNQIKIK
ncbi:MAG: hypothetical protein AABX29_08825 [Nanoarchaeota archaeon]